MDIREFAKLCLDLMDKYDLRSKGWKAKFDNASNRLGQCNYARKTLSFSKYYVEHNTVEDIKDTILHEIAHALTPGAKHGYRWQLKCIEIGAKPIACGKVHIKVKPGKYKAKCSGCGHEYYRHRESKHLVNQNLICRRCGPFRGKLTFVVNN